MNKIATNVLLWLYWTAVLAVAIAMIPVEFLHALWTDNDRR